MDALRQQIDTVLATISPSISLTASAATLTYPPFYRDDEIRRAVKLIVLYGYPRDTDDRTVDNRVADVFVRDLEARIHGRPAVITGASLHPDSTTIWFQPGQEPRPPKPRDVIHTDHDAYFDPVHVSRRYITRDESRLTFLDFSDVIRFQTDQLDLLAKVFRRAPVEQAHAG
jgi:hypothetical protein